MAAFRLTVRAIRMNPARQGAIGGPARPLGHEYVGQLNEPREDGTDGAELFHERVAVRPRAPRRPADLDRRASPTRRGPGSGTIVRESAETTRSEEHTSELQ